GSKVGEGSTVDLGGVPFTVDAGSGIFVVKLDSAGTLLWQQTSAEADPFLLGLAGLPQGSVGVAVSDDEGILLRALDSQGKAQWEHRYPNQLAVWTSDMSTRLASGSAGQLAFSLDAEAELALGFDGGVRLSGCVDLGGGP